MFRKRGKTRNLGSPDCENREEVLITNDELFVFQSESCNRNKAACKFVNSIGRDFYCMFVLFLFFYLFDTLLIPYSSIL